MNNKERLPESGKASDPNKEENPGLKDEKTSNKKDLLNEDPMEEKDAIEKTSEDRLGEAE